MLAGTRLATAIRSPPTASVRLRRSVVVATTWMRSCANPGEARLSQRTVKARRNCMRLAMRKGRAMRPSLSDLLLAAAGARDPNALRDEAMHILLGIRDRPDPASHRHAGEPI